MDPQAEHRQNEDALHALLDGRLPADARAALERRLAQDVQASATLEAWRQQSDALRQLHKAVLTEPVPASLLAAAQHAQQARQQVWQVGRWAGMAASLLLAFGLGWFTHGRLLLPGSGAEPRLAHRPWPDFIQQATLAHAVYVPEVRHPVEVDAAQEAHLVQWLSKRLGRALKAPKLTELGFELVGGRLLPGTEGARALFMYQDARGERVTLYLGGEPLGLRDVAPTHGVPQPVSADGNARQGNPGLSASGPGAEFRYAQDGAIVSFYWVDEGMAYALSGQLNRSALLQLAQQVHAQLRL
ncbi:transmembrane anti-sigma factor [Hylemonella gracilis str. Niagara R]|uniref:Transmembrane anti-sigma factor n=1 Tax=Hylemonella gracilis str. Niagara R TaxID=1458275 RepID=A0A016XJK1_9BURK|nr:anti-sigma factor [Hylemonella gracilis]EYC51403.1 transmembrane anti-sigma factor [Hylemonella gracilis str. Niagara R]